MILSEKNANRLGIFFFYDEDGIVDDYVTTLLAGFTPFFSELTIVVNGKLTDEGQAKLLKYTDENRLIVRENTGFDVWAYKTALNSYGWQKLSEFDEICLFNHTIMGPVYPFSEMFEAMNSRDLDFWGITKYNRVEKDPFGHSPYGYLPEHIQSHFHAYRRSLVSSKAFQDYWDHIPEIKGYNDSVGLHESLFTKRFADKGFKWDVYVDTADLDDLTYGPIMFFTPKLIAEKRCPIFKRRSFFHHYDDQLIQATGNNVLDLYEYLRDQTSYDTDLIWQNALRTMNLADLVKNLHLDYFLPQNTGAPLPSNKRIALVMHLYYKNSIERSLSYVSSMPEGCDVILTTDSEEKVTIARNYCEKHLRNYNIDVRMVENRGRDIAALLVGIGKDLLKYDYVCCIHDKKLTTVSPQNMGYGFYSKSFDNTLVTKEYVENVIHLFENNPRLGIAMPTPPNESYYFPSYTYTWGIGPYGTITGTKKLLKEIIGSNIPPLERCKEAIAPLSGAEWFRPKALQPLFEHKWSYDDFPKEPLKLKDLKNQCIERTYAYIAQSQGYFPAYILSDRFARMEITNLAFEQRELVSAFGDVWLGGDLEDTKNKIKKGKRLRYTLLRVIKNLIKRLPLVGPLLVRIRKKMRGDNEEDAQ
jgi:lipopolysaccharide biosynthesis protein